MPFIARNADSQGVWCSALLTLCLLPLTAVSRLETCKLMLAFSAFLPLTFFFKEYVCNEEKAGLFVNIMFSCFLSTPFSAVISWYTASNFAAIYILCFLTILYYNSLANNVMISCPKSFTVGELQIITQTITLVLLLTAISVMIKNGLLDSVGDSYPILDTTKFLQILFSGCIFLMHTLHQVPNLTFGKVLSIAVFIFTPVLITSWALYLEQNPIIWIINFCLKKKKRMYLIAFWSICTAACIIFVTIINRKPRKIKITIIRKYFHFIIDAVYISGIYYDPNLLYLASGIALAVFIILEACRIINIPLLGPGIDDAFKVFLDEKDSGTLILTHIYLLVGCSLPIWLYNFTQAEIGYHICQMSGVISVGFGDTVAALCGSAFGKHFWKDSNKTLEGSASAVVIQLICALFFLSLGHELSAKNVLLIMSAVSFTSILEAKTTQIDNLILPLFMFSFLAWIK